MKKEISLYEENYQKDFFDKKLVTITLLCYNHEKYVKDCLQSIYEQTYQNMEIIIVDNASNDSTVSIIETFLSTLPKKYVRTKFIKNEKNMGICKGVNQALKFAEGEFIKSFSGDDVLARSAIEEMVKFLVRNPQYNMLVTNGFVVKENYKYNNIISKENKVLLYNKTPNFQDNYFLRLLEQDNIAAPAVMISKETFQKIGYYDEAFEFEDWEFWLRVVTNGGKIAFLNKTLVYYRRSPQATTFMQKGDKTTNEKMIRYIKNNFQVLDKYANMVLEEELKKKYLIIFQKHILKCIEFNCKDALEFIRRESKRRKVKLGRRDKMRYWLYCCNLYDFQKLVRRK